MEMSIEEKNGVKVVYLVGKLESTTSGLIYDDMVKLAQENEKAVINLVDVEYISSAGLRILLTAAKLIQKHPRGALKICEANEIVGNVLEMSGFHSLLNVYATEAEALAAFES